MADLPPARRGVGRPSLVADPTAGPGLRRRDLLRVAAQRPGGRRSINALVVVLLLGGVGMFAYPYGTDLEQSHLQSTLRSQFASPGFRSDYLAGRFVDGQGLTRLRAPKIGLDVVVVQGTGPTALRAGAGHYVDTPLPGAAGNVGIAGHRTTYGRPFNRLNELGPGDHVYLDTPVAEYDYVAVATFDGGANPHPVAPNDIAVIAQNETGPVFTDGRTHLLTLTTCHPKGSAAQRLILRLALAAETALPTPTPGGAR